MNENQEFKNPKLQSYFRVLFQFRLSEEYQTFGPGIEHLNSSISFA